MKSTLPPFMARTLLGTSAWPLMKTMGLGAPGGASVRSCRPFSPGICSRSTTRHDGQVKRRALEEPFGRGKTFDVETRGSQQAGQGSPHGWVVVDDEHPARARRGRWANGRHANKCYAALTGTQRRGANRRSALARLSAVTCR